MICFNHLDALFALLVTGIRTRVLSAQLLLTGPVMADALASAAYRVGIPLHQAVRDDLAQAAKPIDSSTEENDG